MTTFPASSPYVISVGGTVLTASGGGVGIFNQQYYQYDAQSTISKTNRCSPDIAFNVNIKTSFTKNSSLGTVTTTLNTHTHSRYSLDI